MAKMGTIYTVENKEPLNNACLTYKAIYVEDEDGDNERWLLFTNLQLSKLTKLDCGSWVDDLKAGRLYIATPINYKHERYLLKLLDGDNTLIVTITQKTIEIGEKRATLNPEDLPSRSWLEDLKD